MQTIIKARIYLARVVLFTTLTCIGLATAQEPMPFHGVIQGEETAALNADA
jgi:hypothetical protein